jgi:hypothetical protein
MVLAADATSLSAATISPGALVTFAFLSMRLAQPLISIATLQMDIAEVRGAIFQVATVMKVAREASQINGLKTPFKGEITFKESIRKCGVWRRCRPLPWMMAVCRAARRLARSRHLGSLPPVAGVWPGYSTLPYAPLIPPVPAKQDVEAVREIAAPMNREK